MSLRRVIIIFALAFICQLSLINMVAVTSVTPNLILCFTIALAFYYPTGYKCIPVALAAMLLLDICGSPYAGAGTLCLFIVALWIVLCRIHLNPERWITTATVTVISIFIYYLLEWLLYYLMGNPMGFLFMLKKCVAYLIYDLITVTIIYLFISGRIIKKKPEKENEDNAAFYEQVIGELPEDRFRQYKEDAPFEDGSAEFTNEEQADPGKDRGSEG